MRAIIAIVVAFSIVIPLHVGAQQAGPNINVLPVVLPQDAPDDWHLIGDGFLQRQVEPTIAVSTRNPDHLISFFNDYRAVDFADDLAPPDPFPVMLLALKMHPATMMVACLLEDTLPMLAPPAALAEAWVGMSRSYDGGLTWSGGMLPGGPFDGTTPSVTSPIYGHEAATDPVAAAGPCGYVYVVFVAFTRGDESALAVARYQDLNDSESGDTWVYDDTWVLETGNNATHGYFLDKPFLVVDHARTGSDTCGHSVYVSYTTFNGLDKDGKFQSKVHVARSLDGGASWSTTKINKTYGQGQGTAIAIDPREGTPTTTGGGTVYVAFRHFFAPDAMLVTASTDYGNSFSDPVDITQGTPMAPFDQPTIATNHVANPTRDINFRSNAFPTLAVTDFGNVFAAWQERVDINPLSSSFGRPMAGGSPRIVVVKSTDEGQTWTDVDGSVGLRRAIDVADRDNPTDPEIDLPDPGFGALPQYRASGPQMKPRLVFGGGRLLLGYTESRGLLTTDLVSGDEVLDPIDLNPYTGFAGGYTRAFDFRAALLDPVTGQLDSTSQVSRYPISSAADLLDGEENVADIAPVNPPCSPDFGVGLPACVRQLNLGNRPQSGAGTSPFMGDYPDATPSLAFVPSDSPTGWRWATEAGDVPYRGFHVVFPDNRHLVPPTEPSTVDEVYRYSTYEDAGSGQPSCVNTGSRNTDVLTARVDAELVLGTPTSFKQLDAHRSFPFTISNRTDSNRFYRLTITDGPASATFSPKTGDLFVDIDQGVIEVFPYSTVARVLYVGGDPDADPEPENATIEVVVEEFDPDLGEPVTGGQYGVVVFNADPDNPSVTTLEPDEVQDPFIENPFIENPFIENPFIENPFIENPFIENPFIENPFIENPFIENSSIQDVIDTTWTVNSGGSNTAASFFALVNVDNAEQFVGNYAFQLIVYKTAEFASANGCDAAAMVEPQVLSNVVQDPSAQNPFIENPFIENPFIENPFIENPFIENSTFALAPAETATSGLKEGTLGDGTLKAPRSPDQVKILLRAYQLVPDQEILDEGGFFYNPDPAQGGDTPALTAIDRGCDTSLPEEDCYYSYAPDLVGEIIEPTLKNGLAVEIGQRFWFPTDGWELSNQGSAPAFAENRELRHGFYLSADERVQLGANDQPIDGDRLLGFQPSVTTTLDVGDVESFGAAELTVPYDVTPGPYFLVLYVDDYREVSESNEINNTIAVPITILADSTPNWLFIGFDNPWYPYYLFNAGSALPLKWNYADPDTGELVASFTENLEIVATGYAACDAAGSPVGPSIVTLDLPEDAGSSDLRYKKGEWQLNWDTAGQPLGCYFLSIYQPDNTQLDTANSDGGPLTVILR